MPRPTTGFGADHGYNFGGGGLIYIINLVPPENDIIPFSGVSFTLGVNGALIDITTVQITVNAVPAFDGSIPGFVGLFAGTSSFSFSPGDNGYNFIFVNNSPYVTSQINFVIDAETFDGASTNQTFQVLATPSADYPPMPFTTLLDGVSLSEFSGEIDTGLLAGGNGQVFFSPALLESNTGTQFDVDFVEVVVHAGDQARFGDDYAAHRGKNQRPWVWGPQPLVPPPVGANYFPPIFDNPNYKPTWNNPNFTFLKSTQSEARGVLFDTTGVGVSNVTNNGGLIEITTSSIETYVTGNEVFISGVIGVPADGTWFITVIDATHFTLDGSVFSGAYVSGGTINLRVIYLY